MWEFRVKSFSHNLLQRVKDLLNEFDQNYYSVDADKNTIYVRFKEEVSVNQILSYRKSLEQVISDEFDSSIQISGLFGIINGHYIHKIKEAEEGKCCYQPFLEIEYQEIQEQVNFTLLRVPNLLPLMETFIQKKIWLIENCKPCAPLMIEELDKYIARYKNLIGINI